MIWKPWTIDHRYRFMEQLLQDIGHSLYVEACATAPNAEIAAEIWLGTLQVIFAETTSRRRTQALSWDICLSRLHHVALKHGVSSRLEGTTPNRTMDAVQSGEVETLAEFVPSIDGGLPESLKNHARKLIRAHAARLHAVKRHQIPMWTWTALVVMCLFGISATVFGAHGEWQNFAATNVSPPETTAVTLPAPYSHLPITPVGQYLISQTKNGKNVLSRDLLNHLSVSDGHLYVPTLNVTRAWPRLLVRSVPLSTAGDTFQTVPSSVTRTIELVPPTQASKAKWGVSSWAVQVTGSWAVATVDWQAESASSVEQIYVLDWPTGASSLVQTLTVDNQVANEYIVAVGDNRLIVQSALSRNSAQPPVSLPISVYALSGHAPLHALTLIKQLPASFGLMVNPKIESNGILFEGIDGVHPSVNVQTEIWYLMNWDGDLTRLQGPPLDEQPHYATMGVSGGLWWAETTPSTTETGHFQVSMGPLAAINQQTMANLTLSGTVSWFSVSGSNFLWIQGHGNTEQLVVAEVQ